LKWFVVAILVIVVFVVVVVVVAAATADARLKHTVKQGRLTGF